MKNRCKGIFTSFVLPHGEVMMLSCRSNDVVPCGTNEKRTKRLLRSFFWWAIRDSNPGPTGYEPVALTN